MQKVVQLLRFRRSVTRKTSSPAYILFILTFFFSFRASSQDFQNGKVSLDLKGSSLKEALAEIQKQSGVRFIYDQDINKYTALKITHSEKGMTVKKATELVLKGTNLQYVWEDGHVMISEKPAVRQPVPNAAAGQETGSVKGRIVDFETTVPLPGATVKLEGTGRGTISNEKGYYTLNGVRPGEYVLSVTYTGYSPFTELVRIKGNETFDVRMQVGSGSTLGEFVVSNAGRKVTNVTHTTEKALIAEIKNARSVVSGISSQQISMSADRNAAEVVQRISGITVMDDKFVVVRGMNQRYNLTYLNDNVAPSTEVYSRAFALDLIPSRIIDKILVYKSPSPENQADATGGVVKIYTKDAKNVKHFDIEFQTTYRPNTTFSPFLTYQGGKTDWLGFDDGTRRLPSVVPGYGDLKQAKLTPGQYANTFNNVLTFQSRLASPNIQLTANYYNSFKIAGKNLSILSSLSYKNDLLRSDVYQQNGIKEYAWGTTDKISNDNINTQTAQLNLLQNFTYRLGDSSSITFKNFLLQQGQKSAIVRISQPSWGFDASNGSYKKDNILSFSQRFLYAGNVGGTHVLKNKRHNLQWNAGYIFSKQETPDQKVIRLTVPSSELAVGDTSLQWRARGHIFHPDNPDEVPVKMGIISRMWIRNQEGVYNGSLDYTFKASPWLHFRAGTFHQWKERKLARRVYTVMEGDVTNPDNYYVYPGENWYVDPRLVRFREQDLDKVWSEEYFRDDYQGLRVYDRTSGSDVYTGTEQNNSGYVSFQFMPANRLFEVYGGLRFEYNRQKIAAAVPPERAGELNVPILIDNPTSNWLPSINASWRPGESFVMRAGYGKTLNRYEFREAAPYREVDFENNVTIGGNPSLKSATVDNYDLRLEYYPAKGSKGEAISVGVFYKKLLNPIERVNTSNRVISTIPSMGFQNATSATIQGLELEVRKKLDFIPGRFFRSFSTIGSVSIMRSNTRNDTTLGAVVVPTTSDRPLQGQAPYIVNAGLYYDNASTGTKVSAIYNISGTSIYAIGRAYSYNSFVAGGSEFRSSILQLQRHLLDLSFTQRIIRSLQLKFSIQNLLDEPVRFAEDYNYSNKYEPQNPHPDPNPEFGPGKHIEQGDNISREYKPGRLFIVTLSYSL
ncbi:TonB-dependent receptor [Chitinophaga barathri]|uniref:TonB-dependent receptor n=1 Tax=Chitinophaga barathri TaxID=1647451 RepID=A0A3N4MDU9_9BACT|nr:TonB-dependent receptor [Chitinophaga barathri]RPD42064.1 TonB-dependent receptor [Chitinophaga barathri]